MGQFSSILQYGSCDQHCLTRNVSSPQEDFHFSQTNIVTVSVDGDEIPACNKRHEKAAILLLESYCSTSFRGLILSHIYTHIILNRRRWMRGLCCLTINSEVDIRGNKPSNTDSRPWSMGSIFYSYSADYHKAPLSLLYLTSLSSFHSLSTLIPFNILYKMRDSTSRFIELFDDPYPSSTTTTTTTSSTTSHRLSSYDVRLEDVLAHQEASLTGLRSRSPTFSSSKASLVDKIPSNTSPPSSSRWKRLSSSILGSRRALWPSDMTWLDYGLLACSLLMHCICMRTWRVDILGVCIYLHLHLQVDFYLRLHLSMRTHLVTGVQSWECPLFFFLSTVMGLWTKSMDHNVKLLTISRTSPATRETLTLPFLFLFPFFFLFGFMVRLWLFLLMDVIWFTPLIPWLYLCI